MVHQVREFSRQVACDEISTYQSNLFLITCKHSSNFSSVLIITQISLQFCVSRLFYSVWDVHSIIFVNGWLMKFCGFALDHFMSCESSYLLYSTNEFLPKKWLSWSILCIGQTCWLFTHFMRDAFWQERVSDIFRKTLSDWRLDWIYVDAFDGIKYLSHVCCLPRYGLSIVKSCMKDIALMRFDWNFPFQTCIVDYWQSLKYWLKIGNFSQKNIGPGWFEVRFEVLSLHAFGVCGMSICPLNWTCAWCFSDHTYIPGWES